MAKLKGLARLAVAAGFGIALTLGAAAPAFADVTAKAGDARAADVATVGGTGYGTLADAFDAVPADGTETTVMLAADVSGQSEIVVPEGKSVAYADGCVGGSLPHDDKPRQRAALREQTPDTRPVLLDATSHVKSQPGLTAAEMRRAVITAEVLARPVALRPHGHRL